MLAEFLNMILKYKNYIDTFTGLIQVFGNISYSKQNDAVQSRKILQSRKIFLNLFCFWAILKLLRAYSWLCTQGSLWVGLQGLYRMPKMKLRSLHARLPVPYPNNEKGL